MNPGPPFIASQRLRILRPVKNPLAFLTSGYFRGRRHANRTGDGQGAGSGDADDPWLPFARRDLAACQADVPGLSEIDLGRTLLVCDAGIGKTTNLQWLLWQLNAPGSREVAFKLDVAELAIPKNQPSTDPESRLAELLVRELRMAMGNGSHGFSNVRAGRLLERLRRQGRLVLLCDALDQLPDDDGQIVEALRYLLRSPSWERCRIVLSSRPYAVQRYWKKLFEPFAAWQFIQLEEFDEPQQRQFLGDELYEAVPVEARDILSVPRVLYYIRGELDEQTLAAIRTASDVYCFATSRMLAEGLRAHHAVNLDMDEARLLLAAVAFEMTADGNFDSVKPGVIERFRARLAARCERYYSQFDIAAYRHRDWLKWCRGKLTELAGMNSRILDYGLLEAGCPQQIQWRDRSLQEFFAAWWLAKYSAPEDVDNLWPKLDLSQSMPEWNPQPPYGFTLPVDDGRNEFYWVWRYAAEMPPAGRDTLPWIQTIAPFYRPGDGTKDGTSRWSEMIYRSWRTINLLGEDDDTCHRFHSELLQPFQVEFRQAVMGGGRGRRAFQMAIGLLDEFRAIPNEYESNEDLKFTMGSPSNEPERYDDEGPYEDATLDGPFEMACYQVTNAQYELFDPAHRRQRDKFSRGDNFPVIYVSWYDAFAFALWLGDGYGLPTEKQWEYACRAGTVTAFHYGDALSSHQANFECFFPYGGAPVGPDFERTRPVGSYEPNAYGLYDMHGNVWEWCDTWYHEDLRVSDTPTFAGSLRVDRGGGWYDGAAACRSAHRRNDWPAHRESHFGFRLVRRVG